MFERKYTDEIRERAVALVIERRKAAPEDRGVLRQVAEELGVGVQSLRIWMRRLESENTDGGDDGLVEEIEQLRTEIRELRAEYETLRGENIVLKKAFKIFTADWDA